MDAYYDPSKRGTAGVYAAYAIFELGVGEFGNDNFSVETEGGEF